MYISGRTALFDRAVLPEIYTTLFVSDLWKSLNIASLYMSSRTIIGPREFVRQIMEILL